MIQGAGARAAKRQKSAYKCTLSGVEQTSSIAYEGAINPVEHTMAVNSTANLPRGFFLMHNQGTRRPGAWVWLLVFENLKTMMKAPMRIEGEGCNR